MAQKAFELEKFPVTGIVEPRLNGDPIVELVPKSMGGIVDQDGFGQIPPQDRQVFQKVPLNRQARFPEQAMMEELPFCDVQVPGADAR